MQNELLLSNIRDVEEHLNKLLNHADVLETQLRELRAAVENTDPKVDGNYGLLPQNDLRRAAFEVDLNVTQYNEAVRRVKLCFNSRR